MAHGSSPSGWGPDGRRRRFRFPWRTLLDVHRDVDDELAFHIDQLTDELVDAGVDPDAARRQARHRFGDLVATRRSLKNQGWAHETARRRRLMLDEWFRDLRHAGRTLARSPGFSAVAILVLALGIGANTAIFSLVNMLLMRPVLIEDPEDMVAVYSQDTERPNAYQSFAYPTYLDLQRDSDVFSDLAAFEVTMAGLEEGDVTRRVMVGLVSSNYFQTYGVPPAIGRGFTAEEETPGGDDAVAVVSHDFAQRHGGLGAIGSTLRLNGQPITVVGVARDGFMGSSALFAPDLWLPLGLYGTIEGGPMAGDDTMALEDRNNADLMLIGRLRPGLDRETAAPQLGALAQRLEEAYPVALENQTFVLHELPRLSISNAPEGDTGLLAPLLLVMAMAGVVLLIACLNLANMFLARGSQRRTELAIRLSLGGGQWRLLRQLLSEGLVLSLLGGLAGLALSFVATRVLVTSILGLLPVGFSIHLDVSPDLRVLAATFGFCVLATLISGLGPAWALVKDSMVEGLRAITGEDARQAGRHRLLIPRNLSIMAQIALSLALLTAGGLFLRGALEAADQTPGFPLEDGLLVELDTSLAGYDEARSRELYAAVLDRLRALPGVDAAASASIVPFGNVTRRRAVAAIPEAPDEELLSANVTAVSDDYFEAVRLPVLRGREFSRVEATSGDGARVAIVDEPLAERLWPGEDALGQRVYGTRGATDEESHSFEVVGVVPGVRHSVWEREPSAHIYLPAGQDFNPNMHLHIGLAEGLGDDTAFLQTIRQTLRSVDARLPILDIGTLQDHPDKSIMLWMIRTSAKVFTLLGAVALFLALVGIYGVGASLMARRTREIGIRMALGATRGDVLRQMTRESATLTAVGSAVGILLALGTAKLVGHMVYGTAAGSAIVLVTCGLLLASTATLAAYLPAHRAAGIAPTEALRHD